ncbi:MAG: FAD binding domain-containing protein [Pirellulaceae bacterium]
MYTKAESIAQAVAASGEFRAGGTDVQERIRSRIAGDAIIDIQWLPDLDQIEFHDDGVTIGALTTIETIGNHERLRQEYAALTLPTQSLATPQIRSMGTMGGVLCQRTRCWYFRHPDLGCPKKGNASTCPARDGNHHFGVCFDLGPCVHPHPSSIGCALLTYDAQIQVAKRGRITVADLYGDGSDPTHDHTLKPGELITHIHLPRAADGERASYYRLMSRQWAEWPLVEVIVRLLMDGPTIREAKIGVGGVANIPLRLPEVEQSLAGSQVLSDTLQAAADLSVGNANPLPQTGYKLDMVRGAVLHTLEMALATDE